VNFGVVDELHGWGGAAIGIDASNLGQSIIAGRNPRWQCLG
jgi:hypothetical protein